LLLAYADEVVLDAFYVGLLLRLIQATALFYPQEALVDRALHLLVDSAVKQVVVFLFECVGGADAQIVLLDQFSPLFFSLQDVANCVLALRLAAELFHIAVIVVIVQLEVTVTPVWWS